MAELFNLPNYFGEIKYIKRSTKEEVEVIAFELAEQGTRSDTDWVTYIDSEGKEHIKEHLNIQLDFKASNKMSKVFDSIFSNSSYQAPSLDNTRLFEVTKDLVAHKSYTVEDAVKVAKEIVEVTKEIKDE